MLQLLRTRRWIGFTGLVIGAILAFGILSLWQWSRAEDRRTERLELAAARDATAAPLPETATLTTARPWQTFTVTGSYRPDSTVLGRLRYLDGRNGYWVMGALEAIDGRTIWVSRGWIPASGPANQAPPAPGLPTGEVTVSGAWLPFEDVAADRQQGMPAGMVVGVAPGPLAAATSVESTVPGFLQALAVDDPGLQAVTAPEVDEGRNISYAVQWLIFAAVALVGWWVFLRREAQSLVADDSSQADSLVAPG